MEVLRGHFRPEFLNRLDEIILFHRLGQQHMGPIVDIQVARVQRLLADRKVTLDLSEAARNWLGRVGYDPLWRAPAEARDPEISAGPARRTRFLPARSRTARRSASTKGMAVWSSRLRPKRRAKPPNN